MSNLKNNYQEECDKDTLYRIEMLYDRMIWLSKNNKEISVLDIDEKYFNSILKTMRIKYGIRFNLWDKENRLRKVRNDYLSSIRH